MKLKHSLLFAMLAACSFALPALTQAATAEPSQNYAARLQPLNSASIKHKTTGKATFKIRGDKLTLDIRVKGAPPSTTHWQHFHGLKGELAASCPTQSADTNGDGFVDILETEPAAGTTMVPFDTMPAAMDVAHGTYPKASAKGAYHYHEVVSVKKLSAAFAKAFDGQKLDLDKRVVLIHGVPSSMKLPATVKSLGPIPAQVTLPIACGKIVKVK